MLRVLVGMLFLTAIASADEKLAGIAARSVHFGYAGPEGTAFYNEMTPTQSASGTYFMACGFRKGYFGIQEQGNGKKVVIFSVWDPGVQNDPKSVKEEDRVQVLFKADNVRTGRFGNEGTGGQSFLDYDWKLNDTYRFYVHAQPHGTDRTAFSGYFWLPETKEWKHLVTFSTRSTKGALLAGYYSFIEDFKRNKVSLTHARAALFGNGWVRTAKDEWQPLDKARFTGDANPAVNIHAELQGERFLLATGGETKLGDVKLKETITRSVEKAKPPGDLPKVFELPKK